ncbi:MAG: hypothetical protein JNJ73_20450 [Hyphomonadaceae bacterium]|nr:hypothetical protein [Hyphomonadaceae bacterium]
MRCATFALAVALAAAVPAAGCATSDATQAPVSEGVTHRFPASYEIVRAAALESVQRLNVSVEGADETPERYQIRFMKVMGGVPWGDVGVINVVREDPWTTQVVVNSERDGPTQRTSARERQLADQVFSHIAEALARQRQ